VLAADALVQRGGGSAWVERPDLHRRRPGARGDAAAL